MFLRRRFHSLPPLLLSIILATAIASSSLLYADPKSQEFCVYIEKNGDMKQVNSKSAVPLELQSTARCFTAAQNAQFLAQPEEIKLSGTIRKEEMVSSIGRISLRWPRAVETLFGKTPQRAMADAARTASRALKASGFPPKISTLTLEWNVVFMDENLPETQIPVGLISNCHPAWMTPPANIYVVAQRAAAGCGGKKVTSREADAELTHILLHEIGHAVEFQMLKGRQSMDRMQSEGFASWFEQYSSDYSSIIPRGSIRRYYIELAKQSMRQSPTFTFSGSAYDYGRASLFFSAVVDRRGVRGLAQVYDVINADRLNLISAIEKSIGWDQNRLQQEVERLVQ